MKLQNLSGGIMKIEKVYYGMSHDGWCLTECKKKFRKKRFGKIMVGSVTCQDKCHRYKGRKFHRLSKYIKFIKSYVLCEATK